MVFLSKSFILFPTLIEIHSINKYLLHTYNVPEYILGIKYNEDRWNPCFCDTHFFLVEKIQYASKATNLKISIPN